MLGSLFFGIKDAIRELTRNRAGLEPLVANKEIHQLIKNGFTLENLQIIFLKQKSYNVHENAIRNIYQATQSDNKIRNEYKRIKEAYEYLRQIINKDGTPRIDLRTLNFDNIEKQFKKRELKYLAIVDIKEFLQHQLEIMMRRNLTRISFAERTQEIEIV